MELGTRILILIVPIMLAACGPDPAPEADEATEEEMPGMSGMGTDGMAASGGMAGGGDMMARMTGHMAMMQALGGDSIQRALPMHRQMVANMIASMNREMRDMDMPGDEAWDATVDSLRNDLVSMPEMDAAELEALMPAHHRRMTRLMEMHREMMGGMRM